MEQQYPKTEVYEQVEGSRSYDPANGFAFGLRHREARLQRESETPAQQRGLDLVTENKYKTLPCSAKALREGEAG